MDDMDTQPQKQREPHTGKSCCFSEEGQKRSIVRSVFYYYQSVLIDMSYILYFIFILYVFFLYFDPMRIYLHACKFLLGVEGLDH